MSKWIMRHDPPDRHAEAARDKREAKDRAKKAAKHRARLNELQKGFKLPKP
jgi:hypothetical protein